MTLNVLILCLGTFTLSGFAVWAQQDLPRPVEMTTKEDHKHMMDQLGIQSIRRGADGRDKESPRYANYDEAKANPYPHLPDPLLTQDRKRVTTPEMWHNQRRGELLELFDREVYGRVPDKVPSVTWKVVNTLEEKRGEVSIITKDLVGTVDNASYPHVTVEIQASVSTPADAKEAVPVIVQFSGSFFYGRRPGVDPAERPGRGRGGRRTQGPSWKDMVTEKGWGFAKIDTYSIQSDKGDGLTKGIIGLVNKGQPRKPDDWGALRAWAWGTSRLLDYFETDDHVDAKRVGLEGHSRWGKATLVAMAYDPRFAISYVSSSGAGGAKLHRRNRGEIVENVAGSGEYHWMAGNYIKYAGPLTWGDLPVDSHELIALCAPRPVFISSGDKGDGWVDARGMFMAAAHAQPVYEMLGMKGMGTYEFPALETGLMDGEIAYRQHAGGHTDGPNWPTFLNFADRYLK